MTRLIEEEEAFKVLSAYYKHSTPVQDSALHDALSRVPTAVPVIRCKDCKHHGEQYGTGYCMKDGCYGWYDEDYCSRAERRGEG